MLKLIKHHVGVDQYGQTYWLGRHPRKELLEMLGRSWAQKMYRDDTNPLGYRHVGYVIAGLWIEVFALAPLAVERQEAAI